MSATLSGLDKLQKWLDTSIYQCTYRPVPLEEYVQIGGKLMNSQMETVADYFEMSRQSGVPLPKGDADNVNSLLKLS